MAPCPWTTRTNRERIKATSHVILDLYGQDVCINLAKSLCRTMILSSLPPIQAYTKFMGSLHFSLVAQMWCILLSKRLRFVFNI